MYNILIIGQYSYIGNSIENWLLRWPKKYCVTKISVHDEKWREKSFREYDVVINMVAIVHDNGSNKKSLNEYMKVNCDLAVAIFDKCINENIKQYIFFSTGAVYTQNDRKNKDIQIQKNRKCNPRTEYGKSKYAAEIKLLERDKKNTKLSIIRPPMVYGKNCKGNYIKLRKLAIRTPIFPIINNKRSVLYIDNLCEFVRILIQEEEDGIFHPQDPKFVSTTQIVDYIAKAHEHKIKYIKLPNIILKTVMNSSNLLSKVIGNFTYDQNLSQIFNRKYQLFTTEEAINKIETIKHK